MIVEGMNVFFLFSSKKVRPCQSEKKFFVEKVFRKFLKEDL